MSLSASTTGSAADMSSAGIDTLATGSDSLIGLAVIGKVGLVLALMIGVILLGSRLIRRIGPRSLRAGQRIKVVSSAAVGQRERVVVVEVEGTWLVLGVGGGQVNKLHELTAPALSDPSSSPSSASEDSGKGFAERFATALRHNTGTMLKNHRENGREDS
ncbi:flagellar protein FliO/FliZ [Onishia taeanensis]|uniref:Flagellar protein n=1 Tax=Onishia taeanensis TaxID=284577 RepID=A0A328XX75_9GAMM|nr:flagellar biosynthetic protein FliO [Halomonas taeanensis]RAR64608.1 flagellar protein FliO/FliZ [Halomonas taeanensis]